MLFFILLRINSSFEIRYFNKNERYNYSSLLQINSSLLQSGQQVKIVIAIVL